MATSFSYVYLLILNSSSRKHLSSFGWWVEVHDMLTALLIISWLPQLPELEQGPFALKVCGCVMSPVLVSQSELDC